MAIYSLRFQPIERSAGRSAVASAAYRAGVSLSDERLAMEFDFSRRGGVAHSAVLAPGNCPPEFRDRETLWNAAELADRRKDSVPAREILVALPHELDADQRRSLVESFALNSLVRRGMIADIVIHEPGKDGDQRNHHAHILVTTRNVGQEGFSGKNREWDGRGFLLELRQEWAQVQNRYLERCAPEVASVSEKSLADQGSDREPTQHMGPHATAMERRGERTDLGENNRDIEAENAGLEQVDRRLDREVADAWRDGNWVRRPSDEVIREMDSVRAEMARQRDAWSKERGAIRVERAPSVRTLEAELTRREAVLYRKALWREEQAKARARSNGVSAKRIALWCRNPGQAMLKSLASWNENLDRVAKARRETERARGALEASRSWVKSEAGRAHIDNLRLPSLSAASDARTQRRTLERKINRMSRRIESADRDILEVKIAKRLGIEQMQVPAEVPMAKGRGSANARRYFRFSSAQARLEISKAPELDVREALKFIRALAPGAPIPARSARMPDLPSMGLGSRAREPDLPDF